MNTLKLTDKFETALVYATGLHADQARKISGVPYVAHLLSVAALVLEAEGTEAETIAGLLHDSVEDQGGSKTREEIRQIFGDEVVAIIDGCTESDICPKPPWQERKQKYLENLRHASASVRRVSLADKLHNARSLLADCRQNGNSASAGKGDSASAAKGDRIWAEFKAGKAGTLWFYQELLKVYQATGTDLLTEEFSRVVEELGRL
ncbi:MAG: HD domain-containing protein [Cyanomargarita calcarea GSE-NOS-MK-12-04C]|jgi:(p)ppGpp synthase/HD superfamily hydrolase|uniref:HD domain-containing protein n=1 Tax=Cyanomargarita calcarea GSE-NOS-MK-12-04C TaxID=2839659 RepID=A0A951QLU3_9CYAN|nr:HD domain-containing protein [Cyanomargarita calcarea GSE-NOS-MK-12-04C]